MLLSVLEQIVKLVLVNLRDLRWIVKVELELADSDKVLVSQRAVLGLSRELSA